jgi:hypothetical protein
LEDKPEDRKPPVHLYEFGLFRLDTVDETEDRLLYRGRPLILTELEFSLLCILVKNHGRDLSCEALIKEVWPDTYVEPDDNSRNAGKLRKANLWKLQQLVTHLRKKVGWETIKIMENKKGYTLGLLFVKEIPPRPDSQDVYEDLKFNRWIFLPQKGRPITLALGAGAALTVIYLIFHCLLTPGPAGFGAWALSQPIIILSLIQAVVIGGAYAFHPIIFDRGGKDFRASDSTLETSVMRACGYDDPDQWDTAKKGAKAALKDYAWSWKFLLGIWVILYLMILLTAVVKPDEGAKLSANQLRLYYALKIVMTLFNNLNTLALVLCYVALQYPTAVKENGSAASKTRDIVIVIGLALILLFTVAECVVVFLPQFGWMNKNLVMEGMDVASGLLGGTALALYVGRIGSRFLAPPVWLVPALYFYAVIQSLYSFIQNDTVGAFIIGAALILKSLLYLYMAWLFKSGRLLFYMARVRAIYESVNTQWKDFLWNLDKA